MELDGISAISNLLHFLDRFSTSCYPSIHIFATGNVNETCCTKNCLLLLLIVLPYVLFLTRIKYYYYVMCVCVFPWYTQSGGIPQYLHTFPINHFNIPFSLLSSPRPFHHLIGQLASPEPRLRLELVGRFSSSTCQSELVQGSALDPASR